MSSNHSYDDLLSSILKDETEKEAAGKIEFTTEQIVDLVVLCVFAAVETTPKTMAWVVKRLSENPHIISELRVSIFNIKKKKITEIRLV
nr:cytochrome P450 85A1 [Pinus koraiensis]